MKTNKNLSFIILIFNIHLIYMLASDFQSAQSFWQQEWGNLGVALGSPSQRGDELDRNPVEILSGQLVLPLGKVPLAVFSCTCICSSLLCSTTLSGKDFRKHICNQQIFPGFVVQFANDVKILSSARNIFIKFERIS